MKKQTFLMVKTVASAMLIISCSKKESVENVPENKNINGRVVEMGTDLPISGATLITSTCARYDNVFGCVDWNESIIFTGSFGKFIVPRKNFRNHRLEKNGYWSYVNEPDLGSVFGNYNNNVPTPVIYYSNSSTSQLDSLLIKLFPVNNITVRIRNTGSATDAVLICVALTDTNRGGKAIFLRAGIDSTFQYPVFGNSENKIFIRRDFPLGDTGIQTRYIAKNEILNLDISY